MKFTRSLKQNHEFRRLYARGKRAVRPSFAVYAQKNRLGENRLGLTASKKLGNAVVRNRLRRRLREAYRLGEAHLRPGWDVVLVARARAASIPFSRLQRELEGAMKDLGLWQEGLH